MKKSLFTIALCFVVGLSFGQKKAVNAAKNEIKGDKPNLEEARTIIKGAMQDAETKNSAETYYVAGLIEDKQFDQERIKEQFGQKADEATMYKSLGAIMPYFMEADSLDQLPDEKGKVKPKFRKDIKSRILANRLYYINGGVYYNDKQDYATAYNFFQIFLQIPNMEMFKDEKLSTTDSTYLEIKYYAGIMASQMNDHEKAIACYSSMKNDNYKTNEILQLLCGEYEQVQDTLNLVKTLEEGVQKFPGEDYFLLNLISQYIYTSEYDKAVQYLNEAIAHKSDEPQLYDVLGRIYESKGDMNKAMENFKKALEIDSTYPESLGNLGRMYYNQAVEAKAKANEITDQGQFKVADQKADDLFREAMPYYEKAHKLKPEDRDYIYALRGIYYNLGMKDNNYYKKFEEMDALFNK